MKSKKVYDKQKEMAAAKSQAIRAMKRSFSRSKIAQAVKADAVVQGVKGLRGGKLIECAICGEYIPQYKSQVDHIEQVCPIILSLQSMTFEMLYERLFCKKSNLQVLCKDCHQQKTKKETAERAKWRRKKKYLVCRRVGGSRIKVFPVINLKDFISEYDDDWDILGAFTTRNEADSFAKKRRKL